MKARELITLLARDYLIYGGYSLQVIRSKTGKVVELYYLDFRYCRTDSDNEVIYYNPEFSKKYGRTSNMVLYPRFISNGNAESSVVYVKNTVSSTYPIPRYSGAIKSCLIEGRIDDLHLNGLANGFMSSYLINFNNGTPTDEQKKEIEKAFKDKFSGTENAGKIILSFNNGKDNMATVQKLDAVDFSEKYDKASSRSREQIFAAFRANPQLFGHATANTGFSRQEFLEAYQLYYVTVVKPIQRLICDYMDRVFNTQDSFTIDPFNLDGETNNEDVN